MSAPRTGPVKLRNSPMSLALAATGLLSSATNFLASRRISMMLFSRAKSGARGKEATNSVTNPNWMTRGIERSQMNRGETEKKRGEKRKKEGES